MYNSSTDPSEIVFVAKTESPRGVKLHDTLTARFWRVEEDMRLWLHKSLRAEKLGDERYRQMWCK